MTNETHDEKKPGPMVVVRRAKPVTPSAAEAKPEAPAPAETAEAAAPAAEATPAEAPGPIIKAIPAPRGPSVADEVPEAESFGDMFEKSVKSDGLPSRKGLRPGEKVRAKVFQLGAEMVFCTVGKVEAMIELDALKDEEGVLRFGVGDEFDAFVSEAGAKGIYLTRKVSKGAASLSLLQEAQKSGLPVEGLVIAVNKGGLEVAVGDTRAFCPASQVDLRFVGKLDSYVGERMTFRVQEVKEKKIVLSRRAILEEEAKAKAEVTRATLHVGAVLKGVVTNVLDFGAFVDLGGLEGMIPVSEMSHVRVAHATDVVKPGDNVEVEVLRMEPAEPKSPDKSKRKERITLSMRKLQKDPFLVAMEELKEGQRVKGKVVRLQPFGAFVELKPGVDGLIHVSAMSDRRIAHPRDVLKTGEEVEVQIEKLDPAEKRIGLRLVKDGALVGEAGGGHSAPAEGATDGKPRAAKSRMGSIVTGKVERIEQYGIFISWDGGKGLIPASETGTERGTDLRRVFPLNTEVTAQVIELQGDKLKLSINAAKRAEERADLDAWKKTQKQEMGGGKGFGTLADKFKNLKLG